MFKNKYSFFINNFFSLLNVLNVFYNEKYGNLYILKNFSIPLFLETPRKIFNEVLSLNKM